MDILDNITCTDKKTGKKIDVSIVDLNDLNDLKETIVLHNDVISKMTAEEREFVLPKSAAYFKGMQKETGRTLGAVVDGKLIGKAILSTPSDGAAYNGLEGMKLPIKNSEIAVLESATVQPEYRSYGIGQCLSFARRKMAKDMGKKALFSQIHYKNAVSCYVQMKQGMVLVEASNHPEDKAPIFYLKQDLVEDPKAHLNPQDAITVKTSAPFDEFKAASEKGYVGAVANKSDGGGLEIVFWKDGRQKSVDKTVANALHAKKRSSAHGK